MKNKKHVSISCDGVYLNKDKIFNANNGAEAIPFFKEIYKYLELNYPKFFKMDPLSKLGFLTAELLLNNTKDTPKENYNIILACTNSSIESDTQFQQTIDDPENYFPSPSVFVYTLPNIVIGEIAIRHQIFGDNCMYIISPEEKEFFFKFAEEYIMHNFTTPTIFGFLDFHKASYYAEFYLNES